MNTQLRNAYDQLWNLGVKTSFINCSPHRTGSISGADQRVRALVSWHPNIGRTTLIGEAFAAQGELIYTLLEQNAYPEVGLKRDQHSA